MKPYSQLTANALTIERDELLWELAEKKTLHLSLNMSRGKPDSDQLALSAEMFNCVSGDGTDLFEDESDLRNYGLPLGTSAARALFGAVMSLPPQQVIVGGSSSLAMMYDTIARGVTSGMLHSQEPWSDCKSRKFLCPCPGYDRHFAITQQLGFELIPVPMLEDGPDMDIVEKLIANCDVKGIWCVPTYSNPTGYTFSNDVVRRIAALKPTAADFVVMWDNAYLVHHLTDDKKQAANIFELAREYDNEDMIITFVSTSKITFPGAGVAAMGASQKNIDFIAAQMNAQTLGADKLNMLRHTKFLHSPENIERHMQKHASILRPKFELVLDVFKQKLNGLEIATWTTPKGGYFITFFCPDGCAREIVKVCAANGVQLTPAGSTHPYGNDPRDNTIRIAPSTPSTGELRNAAEILCICTRLAAIKKMLDN